MGHEHWWERLPVTDLTVTYRCSGCPEQHKLTWGKIIPSTCEIDKQLTDAYGGTVRGEAMVAAMASEGTRVPFEFTLPGAIRKIHQTGLLLTAEDLDGDDE